ncbi:hypothetical protein BMAFMH_C0467, partial [Burkholderia mallei FMH]
VVAEMRGARK